MRIKGDLLDVSEKDVLCSDLEVIDIWQLRWKIVKDQRYYSCDEDSLLTDQCLSAKIES